MDLHPITYICLILTIALLAIKHFFPKASDLYLILKDEKNLEKKTIPEEEENEFDVLTRKFSQEIPEHLIPGKEHFETVDRKYSFCS